MAGHADLLRTRVEAGVVESSISLLREPNSDVLGDCGQVIAITLRLLGPLFFGLALLSLRGRVKRDATSVEQLPRDGVLPFAQRWHELGPPPLSARHSRESVTAEL
jgi:hypothetical protein